MKVFAISDLHLPGSKDKTMDMFGNAWQGHWDKIKSDWLSKVESDDIVLICGDISWAMQLSEALPDLNDIAALPGKKILIKGNHDFWWNSVTKVRGVLKKDMFVLQNDALRIENFIFAGTRGWMESGSADDKKIFARELIRLDLTLSSAERLRDADTQTIALMHYPPVLNHAKFTAFCEKLEQYGVKKCIYGHLHGVDKTEAEPTIHNGITYMLSSCDMTGFKLIQVV